MSQVRKTEQERGKCLTARQREAIAQLVGEPVDSVADAFGVHRTTITRIWARAKAGSRLNRAAPREQHEHGRVWVPHVDPVIQAWLLRRAA